MSYCTEDDVRARIPEGQLDPYLRGTETSVSDHIAAAQDELDPLLEALGYDVPFADGEVPALVKALAAWKTVELLCFRIPGLTQWHDAAERKVRDLIRELRAGQARPPEDGKPATYRQQMVVLSGGDERRFTAERLKEL